MADRKGLPEDVRAELRAIRLSHGLTQRALAGRIGCALNTVKRIERGVRHPSPALERAWRLAVSVSSQRNPCEGCGKSFESARAIARFCSSTCAMRANRRRNIGVKVQGCIGCGIELWRKDELQDRRGAPGCRLCRPCARDRKREVSRRNAFRRRGAPKGTPYTLEGVAERDRWRCHLCGKRVKKSAKWPDQMCPSIDHLVPISAGGVDGAENVALAHWYCNTLRGTRGKAQLRLTG